MSKTEITYLVLDNDFENKIEVLQKERCTDPDCNCNGVWGELTLESEASQEELIKGAKSYEYVTE